ncbi:MAG: hypothetical protein IJS01_13645 [Lentisphaeria bacterium]|nr:hypothetical protein [Lentisphaeria bacterium]
MIMLWEDKEANLIESFRQHTLGDYRPVLRLPDIKETRTMMTSIVDDEIWKNEWVDSSSKNDPPPDFYSESQKLMMEAMRIDDHAFEQDGRIKNPTNQRARMKGKELRDALHLHPGTPLFVNAPTGLPSSEDHNYRYYKSNFTRVIKNHIEKIPAYKSNHPDCKLIFFVFDESSMYLKTDTPNQTIKRGEQICGVPHCWYLDKAFIGVFVNSGIDYLIWITPYKHVETLGRPIKLPLACVFDCNQVNREAVDYPEDYMVSAEE